VEGEEEDEEEEEGGADLFMMEHGIRFVSVYGS